jgi:hypothetical protein
VLKINVVRRLADFSADFRHPVPETRGAVTELRNPMTEARNSITEVRKQYRER